MEAYEMALTNDDYGTIWYYYLPSRDASVGYDIVLRRETIDKITSSAMAASEPDEPPRRVLRRRAGPGIGLDAFMFIYASGRVIEWAQPAGLRKNQSQR